MMVTLVVVVENHVAYAEPVVLTLERTTYAVVGNV